MPPCPAAKEIVAEQVSESFDSRSRILRAALVVGADRGYAGTTIDRVSRAAGLPASSIYWHFGNKDRLLAEAMSWGVQHFVDDRPEVALPPPAGPTTSSGRGPEGAVLERLRWGAEMVMRRPGFWQLGLMLALEDRFEEPEARHRFLAAVDLLFEALERWWAALLPDRLADQPEKARALASFHLAVLNGFYLARAVDHNADLPEIAALVARGLLRALDPVGKATT